MKILLPGVQKKRTPTAAKVSPAKTKAAAADHPDALGTAQAMRNEYLRHQALLDS